MDILRTSWLLLSIVLPGLLVAQGPSFSQFFGLPVVMNPAYVSVVKGVESGVGYRHQWGQIQGGFNTLAANAQVRACQAPVAFGLLINEVNEPLFGYREQEAAMQLGAFIGQGKRFSFHGALQAGIGDHRVNYDELLFFGQLDPVFGVQGAPSAYFQTEGARVGSFQVGGGLVGRGQLRWRNTDLPASIGASVLHLGGSRDVSFLRFAYQQARRFTVHGSVTTPLTGGLMRKDILYLNWIARMEWESALQRSATGVIFQYEQAHIGLVYQWNKSPFRTRNTHGLTVTAGVDFKMGDRLNASLMYAYDGTLGGLGQAATGGVHEVILVARLPQHCLFKGRNPRGRTDCYDFTGKGYRRFLN